MPAAVPYIIEAAAAITDSVVVAVAVAAVASTVLQKYLTKKGGAGLYPINVTVRSTVASRQICLGTVRSGGSIVFFGTSGTNNKFLWYVVCYAGHQCSALKDLYLDKFKVPAADINGSTGAVSTAALNGKLKCWDHLGTGAQTVDTNLDAAFTEFSSTSRLRSICYRVLQLERDDKAWPNGAPQDITSVLDGALQYDPRLDSTNGGSGTHRASNPSTWAFSRNWATGMRWLMTGGSIVNDQSTRIVKYGMQEADSRIDDSYIIAAANISDQSLSGGNAPPSGAQARYTLDGVFMCDEVRRDIIERALMAGGPGQLTVVKGKHRLYAGAYDAPVLSFTQDDLAGEMQTDDTSGDDERFNQFSGIYIDASQDYTEQTTPVRTNAAYVTQDAGQEIPRDPLELRCVSDQYRAQRIIELMMRRSRQMRKGTLVFKRTGMRIAPWETFNFSHSRYGWTNRVLRCLTRDVTRNDTGGIEVVITYQQEASSVYTDLVTADYTTGTSVSNALQSEPPDPPTSLAATSKNGAIVFTWGLGSFWYQNGVVELWEAAHSAAFGTASLTWEGSGTATATIEKQDTVTRDYWVRVRTKGAQLSTTEPASSGLPAAASASVAVYNVNDAGAITKTVTAPSSNTTAQVKYVEITHDPATRVEVQATFRVAATTGASVWQANLSAFWGTTGGSVNALGQVLVKSTLPYEFVTVIGTLPPGSVVGTATRRFGIGVDEFSDGINNLDVIFRDMSIVVKVYSFNA